MPALLNRGVTFDEFIKMEDPPDGSQLELYNGEVITLPPPKGTHGIVCARFARIIGNFADEHKLGHVASNDTGVVIIGERDSLRGVDVGFWSFEHHPHMPIGYFDTVPDLAIEVLSPNYSRRMIREKVKQYIEAGVRLVWLVDPEARTVLVYEGTVKGVEFGENDALEGGNVLPGFSRKIGDLI